MSDEDLKKLKQQIVAQVKHETRWTRRVPVLIGGLGVVCALLGFWHSSGALISIGGLVGIAGFGAQAVLWYGLRDEGRL
ncbi:hypothetical protein [Pseudomonas sp. R5(2019)]|uniref:hypothetical protein n=1 Tax=Pseudomonas sp. R5(2019) TaxID=2697566 RepID=UPI0014122A3A|nr:hypothetical protein [Pseudomonas sp. R5(2019)]NBA98610.1 hypothetical protein [Pseudomonas sp. R5(2019)]